MNRLGRGTSSWVGRLDPDGPTARRWLEDELAKPDYRDGRSLIERVTQWIRDQFDKLQIDPDGSPGVSFPPFVAAIVALLVVAVIGYLLSRLRVEHRVRGGQSEAVLGDLDLTAEQFRERGAAAFRDGRFDDAVVEYVRALARESADRTLLVDAPSLTAHEIGSQLAPVFPAHVAAIVSIVDLFDEVRYGRRPATAPDAERARVTEETVRRARPVLDSHPSLDRVPNDPNAGAAR